MCDIYKEIEEIEELTKEETNVLFEKYRAGDMKAKEKIINSNLKKVMNVARKYSDISEFDDLFQAGCIGLMRALEHYDPSFNKKFSAYAENWMKKEMRMFIGKENSISISKKTNGHLCRVKNYINEFEKVHNKKPSVEEISIHTGINEQSVVKLIGISKDRTAMKHIEDDFDILSDYDFTENSDLEILLIQVLTTLEYKVVKMHSGLYDGNRHTYVCINRFLNVNNSDEIYAKAIKKLRASYMEVIF